MKPKISIIGLGKLGLPFMACFASKGFKVIGVDIDIDKLCKLSWGVFRLVEPDIERLLSEHTSNFSVTNRVKPAVMDSEVTLILVPTPSDMSGAFSTKFILSVCEEVAEAICEKEEFHLVVVLSTVMPGSMAKVKRYLEEKSGKRCGEDFGLCYSPELVAIGNIVHTFLNPDFVMIGESDAKSGKMLSEIYRMVFNNSPPIERTNWVNVELAKISVNAYITTKISFANSLAEICEHIPEADANWITRAIGQDRRIGRPYFKGALGYAGYCFPRDSRAFIHMAEKVGVDTPIAKASDAVNNRQVGRIVDIVRAMMPQEGKVAVLGIAFKPQTNTTEESQGLAIAQELAQRKPVGRGYRAGVPVHIHDPLEPENLSELLVGDMTWIPSLAMCLEKSDVVVIANPCQEYQDLAPENFRENSTVLDCWNLLDISKFQQERVKHLRVGAYSKEKGNG